MSAIHELSRRHFLTHGMGLLGVGALAPGYLRQAALAGPSAQPGGNILVLLQLAGGHDAISALVPYGHQEYGQLRQATRIADSEVIKINNELGLHPKLAGFKALLDDGAFAALPGVGYPEPNYSHFTSTDMWFTADLNPSISRTGWLGRACDQAFKGSSDPKLAIAVGTIKTPRILSGQEHPGLSFSSPDSYRYSADRGDMKRREVFRKVNEAGGGSAGNLDFISQTAANANATSDLIRKVASEYKPKAEYPKTRLGTNLRIIAALINGGLSTRIYYTEAGGFDTHSRQRPAHDNLMAELNDAVSAFYKDMIACGQGRRVLTFTSSEFGRRVKENGSEGTDHGAASAMFMFGQGVKPGIHGQHPSLTDVQGGAGGSLKHTHDFRSVYATLLEKWLSVPSQPVLGGQFPLIDCLAS